MTYFLLTWIALIGEIDGTLCDLLTWIALIGEIQNKIDWTLCDLFIDLDSFHQVMLIDNGEIQNTQK